MEDKPKPRVKRFTPGPRKPGNLCVGCEKPIRGSSSFCSTACRERWRWEWK